MPEDEHDTTRDTVRQFTLPNTVSALPPADQVKSSGTAVLATVENALKIIVASVGLVAALGFPAVYLHFSTFGVPTTFISYDHVLRAGALPAVLLMLFGTYVYWTVKEVHLGMTPMHFPRFSLIGYALILPLYLPLMISTLVGGLSMQILLAWAIVWPFAWSTSRIFGIDIDNRVKLCCAIALYLIVHIIVWRKARDKSGNKESYLDRANKMYEWLVKVEPMRTVMRAVMLTIQSPKDITGRGVIITIATIILSFNLIPYSIKGVLYLWDPSWSQLLPTSYILGLGNMGALLCFLTFMLLVIMQWLDNDDHRVRRMGFFGAITVVLVLYLVSVGIYSYILYPRLPQGLGGGKPTQVVLWIGKDDLPPDVRERLPAGLFSEQGSVTRIEYIYLFSQDEKRIILVDESIGPALGLLVLQDKIKAISW